MGDPVGDRTSDSAEGIPGIHPARWLEATTAADVMTRLDAEPTLLNVRDADSDAFTLLHHAAAVGRTDLLDLILGLGGCVDEPSGHPDPYDDVDPSAPRFEPGYTPLMCAARYARLGAVRHLLAAGAEPSKVDRYGGTALHSAAVGGSVPVVNLLLASGCDPAAECWYKRACEELGYYWVGTPLHVAGLGDEEGVCSALLGHGASVDASAPLDERRPLHYAAAVGAKKALAVLLRHGADPTRPEKFHGQTPLHYAVRGGHVECIELLLQHGADPDARCETGDKPADSVESFYIPERVEQMRRLFTSRARKGQQRRS